MKDSIREWFRAGLVEFLSALNNDVLMPAALNWPDDEYTTLKVHNQWLLIRSVRVLRIVLYLQGFKTL